jgi:hypothetical protein
MHGHTPRPSDSGCAGAAPFRAKRAANASKSSSYAEKHTYCSFFGCPFATTLPQQCALP